MSSFEVKVRKLGGVRPHPNADRLSIAQVDGFVVVTQIGRFQDGDLAVYVPEGGVVPEEALKVSGFWNSETGKGMLAGSKGDRVKPIKLRGVLSEGILLDVGLVREAQEGNCDDCPYPECPGPSYEEPQEGDDVGQLLGITKYEVPIPAHLNGKVYPLAGTIKTNSDPDNIKKITTPFLDGDTVVISEKVHGSATITGLRDGELYVTSKGMAKKGLVLEDEKDAQGRSVNFYHRCLQAAGGEAVLRRISEEFGGGQDVALYGESWPCQNLKYGAPPGSANLAVFDIRIGDDFVSHELFMDITSTLGIPTVPILYVGPYSKEVLEGCTNGREQLSGKEVHIREGAVVKRLCDRRDDRGGRIIYKSISPKYLALKDLTEYN